VGTVVLAATGDGQPVYPEGSSVAGAEGMPAAGGAETETAESSSTPKPTEAYNRKKHYGNTPTAADREAVGGSPDHDPPLVKRYYEGDPARGEKPGYLQTPEECAASAGDRSRIKPSTVASQRSQGAEMAKYSRQKKKELGLD
jgi:hypothetical protein